MYEVWSISKVFTFFFFLIKHATVLYLLDFVAQLSTISPYNRYSHQALLKYFRQLTISFPHHRYHEFMVIHISSLEPKELKLYQKIDGLLCYAVAAHFFPTISSQLGSYTLALFFATKRTLFQSQKTASITFRSNSIKRLKFCFRR